MTPTPDDWQTFAALLGILGILGGAVVGLQRLGLLRRTPPPRTGSVPPDVAERLERHADRLARLEAAVSGLASREDIHALKLSIERQAGGVRELRMAIEQDARAIDKLSASITRIEDHLMKDAH